MLQEGADPKCNIYERVTKQQIEQYEKGLTSNKYQWDYSAEKPEDSLVSAFAFVLRQDWKDLAYIMLEVSKLPMFDAIQVYISSKKTSKFKGAKTNLKFRKFHSKWGKSKWYLKYVTLIMYWYAKCI